MIYHFLPENQMNQVRDGFNSVNEMPVFTKSYENLIKMEQNDELSDFDDQDIFDEFKNPFSGSSNKGVTLLTNENQSQEIVSEENQKV